MFDSHKLYCNFRYINIVDQYCYISRPYVLPCAKMNTHANAAEGSWNVFDE